MDGDEDAIDYNDDDPERAITSVLGKNVTFASIQFDIGRNLYPLPRSPTSCTTMKKDQLIHRRVTTVKPSNDINNEFSQKPDTQRQLSTACRSQFATVSPPADTSWPSALFNTAP